MREEDEFGSIPPLDDRFVAQASFREPSLRDRELEAERRAAQEREARSPAELGSPPLMRRQPPRTWVAPTTPYRRPSRRRQAIGVIIAVVVLVAAYVPTRFVGGHGKSSLIAPYLTPDTSCSSYSYPPGAGYRFEACVDSQPVHWPRCETLLVSIDPANAPSGYSSDVDYALKQLSSATGLGLKPTTSGADVSIGWDRSMVLQGFGHKDKAGVTSLEMQSTLTGMVFKSAGIEISSDLPAGHGSNSEVPVLLHELGHAVGLGHFEGPEVMNPVDSGFVSYQNGDLAGLATLYRGQGCS
jgi:hypothetical protein